MGIVVIGAVFVDIKGYPLSTYIPGGRNAGRIEQVHGGVSRNVVEDIANVELRPTFVGLVDDTGMGQDVIDKLARHKVNTRFIQKKPDGMGTWLAIFDNDGDVHAAISKRPNTTPLTGLLQEQGDEIFADCDSIALELDLEKETVKQTLRYAKKHGKKVFAVVSNMSIAMERRDFLQQIDCFVCNQQEAGLLFSDDYDHLSPDEMCRVLTGNVRSANIPSMVVTQMLDSMQTRAVPTRAEVSDIYNAVLDGASCLMLPGETAAGQYPVQAMEYLVRTARTAM